MKCQTCSALCLIRSAVISLLIALFVFVVVPTQTYLGSPDLFDYSYAQLLGTGLLSAVASAMVGVALLWLLDRFVGTVALAVGLAILTCLYLETGILSIGLPALNGVQGFGNLIRSAFDALAWIVIIALFAIFRAFVVRNFKWFVSSLAILIVASVFDAGGGSKVGVASPLAGDFCSCYDVARSIRFSCQRNVLVFVLDMTPATIITDALERCPELKEKFPGFAAFRKNLAMHEETAYGLPGLMTGKYFGPEHERGSFGMKVFGDESFLYPYAMASNAVYCAGGLHEFGFTNRPARGCETTDEKSRGNEKEGCVFSIHSPSIPYLRMRDAMAIRTVPYFFKNKFLHAGLAAAAAYRPATPGVNREGQVVRILSETAVTNTSMTLAVVHTSGLHWPITVDRNGQPLAEPLMVEDLTRMETFKQTYRLAMREAGIYLLRQMSELMEVLRSKGVYDNSTIFFATDHGCLIMKEGENHGAESGVLWVKPERSRTPFHYSDAPTTNARVHDLICDLQSKSLDEPAIVSRLVSSERIFRAGYHGVTLHAMGGKLHYRDWVYDEQGNLKELRQE